MIFPREEILKTEWSRKMAQHLRVVAALPEPQSLIPVPTTGSSQVSLTVIPRGYRLFVESLDG